jgi:hypothetical protein
MALKKPLNFFWHTNLNIPPHERIFNDFQTINRIISGWNPNKLKKAEIMSEITDENDRQN